MSKTYTRLRAHTDWPVLASVFAAGKNICLSVTNDHAQTCLTFTVEEAREIAQRILGLVTPAVAEAA